MKQTKKISFERIWLHNRWKGYGTCGDWTIVGISKWWCGPCEYCYKLCLFGLEIHIWFNIKYM